MGPRPLNTNLEPGPVNTNSRAALLNTNWGPGPVITNWGPGLVNTNRGPWPVNTRWGPGSVNTNWRPGPGAGDQANGREPGNTNNRFLRDFEIVDDHLADTKHQKVTVCPPINARDVY